MGVGQEYLKEEIADDVVVQIGLSNVLPD
jgi:hypothetical protein